MLQFQNMNTDTRINLFAPEEIKAKVERRAELEGLPVSEIIRRAINFYCRNNDSYDEENRLSDLPEKWKSRYTVDEKTGCWNWIGATAGGAYPHARYKGRTINVHRFSYSVFVGPIPKGHVIHHECRNKSCLNPKHLRSCTQAENIMADFFEARPYLNKNKCVRGHEFNAENTGQAIVRGRPARVCLACRRLRDRAKYHSQKRAA